VPRAHRIAPEPPDAATGERLERVDLSASRRPDLAFADVELHACNLANLDARGGSMRRVVAERCRLTGLLWTEGSLRDVVLRECRIDLASFAATTIEQTVFEECLLAQTDFQDARLRAVRFVDCDLSGADLSGARFERCELRGCTLDGIRASERLRGVAMPWPDILASAGTFADALGVRVIDDGADALP
jgi:uncharacterized protein YjbI with pentapeptide repeats